MRRHVLELSGTAREPEENRDGTGRLSTAATGGAPSLRKKTGVLYGAPPGYPPRPTHLHPHGTREGSGVVGHVGQVLSLWERCSTDWASSGSFYTSLRILSKAYMTVVWSRPPK